jgi:hypothetical protein
MVIEEIDVHRDENGELEDIFGNTIHPQPSGFDNDDLGVNDQSEDAL